MLNKCDSAIRILDENLQTQQQYYKDHYQTQRPFYNMAIHELRFYTSLLTNAISEAPEKWIITGNK